MSWAEPLWLRLKPLFRRGQVARELDGEIQFHLEQQTAENIALGMSPGEARRKAIRSFGNLTSVREQTRETWGWIRVEAILQDIRYALRQLKKTPGFTATALLTLALGIGANAAIFTLVDGLMLRKLPVADPQALVRLGDNSDCCVNSGGNSDGDTALFSTEVYDRLKKSVPEFAQIAGMQAGFAFNPVVVRRDGAAGSARSVSGEFVSGSYFQTLGLRPAAGRLFAEADDVKGASMVAVMSFDAWRRDYASDATVVGSTFWVNTKPVTIVGIAPEGFYGDRLSTTP
ncbi:MAG TPA: ABC transporter permease, partial [Candidatus Acidoferrum sp.]|nr:ABC transporter permease [Candidatus Acidoferrum sp.]